MTWDDDIMGNAWDDDTTSNPVDDMRVAIRDIKASRGWCGPIVACGGCWVAGERNFTDVAMCPLCTAAWFRCEDLKRRAGEVNSVGVRLFLSVRRQLIREADQQEAKT